MNARKRAQLPRRYRLQDYLITLNEATCPWKLRTEHEHKRCRQVARAVEARLKREGFREGWDYRELSNGALWPIYD